MNKRIWLLVTVLLLGGCGSPEQKVEEFVANAKKHLSEGNYDAAHLEFRNALQINPNHIEALYHVTKVFEHQEDWRDSYRYLERVLELNPEHVDALISIGTIELSAKQLDKAVERSEAAMNLAPTVAKVRAFNSVLRLQLGDLKGAVEEANAALAVEPYNLEATIVLASERLSAKDTKTALMYLNQYEGKYSLALAMMKVRAYNLVKDLEGAVSVFEELIKTDPAKDEYHYSLAKQYLAFNKIKEADEVLRAHLEQNPDDINSKLLYIQFLNQYMGEGRSVAQLKSFIHEKPEDLQLNFALAEVYRRGNHTDEARNVLIKLASLNDVASQVRALNRLAKLEFNLENYEEGDEYLKQSLALDSDNEEAIIASAQRKLQHGNTEQAIAELRAVLRGAPNSAVVLGLLGNAHEKQGKVELALDQYAKAYEAEPKNRMVIMAYSQLLKKQGQYNQIEKLLDRYLQIAHSDVEVLQIAAENKLALRNWGDAQLIANRMEALKYNPSVTDQIRGSALLGMDNWEQGLEAFERAYEVAEDKSRSMALLVRSYVASKQTDKAKEFLDSILENDAGNLTALNLMAQLHQFSDDLSGAEQWYKKAVAAHPENLTTYQQLSAFLMRQNKPEAVIELLQEIDKVSENPALLLIKAGAFEAMGEKGNAISSYEQVLKLQSELDVAVNNLAVLLTEDSEYQNLERAKQLAIRFKQSEFPYFQDTLGWVYYKTGDIQNALYFHENAVQSMPEFAEFRYHLGMSYIAAGELEKARVELEKALQLAEETTPGWKTAAKDAIGNL